MIETFDHAPQTRWRFIADPVMGGVSSGSAVFVSDGASPGDGAHLRMTGTVSTRNNGGFIQVRMDLASPPPDTAQGVRLIARGNGERYFIHLRTADTARPWQYYQAGFDTGAAWADITLPFAQFGAFGGPLPSMPAPARITSIGIVAFGRDHEAQIDVCEIGFY